MQKFLKSFVLSVFTISVFTLSATANANLIINGSFESLYDASGGEITNLATAAEYTAGDGNRADYLSGLTNAGNWGIYDSLLGWSTIEPGIEVQYSGTVVDASDGTKYLELDTHTSFSTSTTDSNGGIFQDVIGLTIGESYSLSFDYQGRKTDADSNVMTVSWTGDAGTDNELFDITEEYTDTWTTYIYSFIASDTTMTIQFEGSGKADSKGALLDNVSLVVVEVPEPSVIFLMLIALCGMTMRKKVS